MKTLYKIGMLAVAALAFVGCSKEVDNSADQKVGTHTLTFKVIKDVDTKTAVVEGDGVASYVWTEKDDQYFHIYENGVEATEITMDLSDDNKIATFTATFANSGATEFSYRATYGSDLANNTPHNPVIPSNQKPLLNSFDPAADILVSAEDIVLEGNAKADENTEFLFKLRRVVSVNKMTLKGLAAGETVKTVVLRSSDSYFIARYKINDDAYANESKELTLDYSNLDGATVGSEGSFPVYFTSAPVTDASFSITVTTDQHIYTRDDFTSKLTLAVGTFRRFGINLSGYGEDISEGTKYTLVESTEDLYSGATYLIVGGETFAMAEQKNNNRGAVEVTDKDGVITIDNTIDAYPVVIEETTDGYLIKDIKNNGYLYTNATSANQLKNEAQADEYAVWGIAISEGVASISNVKNTSRGQMRFNPNNGSPMFAAYANSSTAGSAALALYVDESTCVAHPRIIATPSAIENVPYAGVEEESNLTFVLKDLTGTATASCDGAIVTEAEVVDNSVIYSVSANTGEAREGWIEIAVGEVSVRVPVYQEAAPAVATIAKILADGAGTYNVNNVLVYAVNGNNVIIGDESGKMLLYMSGHNMTVGDLFNVSNASVSVYEATGVLQMTNGTFTKVSSGNTVNHGTALNLDNETVAESAVETFSASGYHSAVFVTISGKQSGRYINGEYATVYLNLANTTFDGKNVIATGYIYNYHTSNSGSSFTFQEVSLEEDPNVASLTVDPTSLTWNADSYGSSNAKTISVSINDNASGYSVDFDDEDGAWSVTDNGAGTISVYPIAANSSTSTAKTLVISISHDDNNELLVPVTCTQNKAGSTVPNPETIVFADLGLENGVQYLDPFDGGNFTITFAGGGNDGKYYTTGSGIRVYGGGSLTIESSYTISSIEFTWDGSNAPTADNATPSGYSTATKTWTGEANSVKLTRPSGSGHWRLQKVKVTYKQ